MQILNVGLGQQMQEIARKVVSLYYVANQIILSVESEPCSCQLYFGEINGETNVYEHILSQPSVLKRRNSYIIESELNPLNVLPIEKINYPLQSLHYLHRGKAPQSGAEQTLLTKYLP